MKTRMFVITLLVAVVGFSACKEKVKKSSENEISTFVVNGVSYDINPNTGVISKFYAKTAPVPPATEGTWAGLPPNWPTSKATVTLKDTKAKMNPDPNVTDINLENTTIVVTAENGDTKTYRVQAEKGGM